MWWSDGVGELSTSITGHRLRLSLTPFRTHSGLEGPDADGLILPDGISEELRIGCRLHNRTEIRA